MRLAASLSPLCVQVHALADIGRKSTVGSDCYCDERPSLDIPGRETDIDELDPAQGNRYRIRHLPTTPMPPPAFARLLSRDWPCM
jgi:hypothetical protein